MSIIIGVDPGVNGGFAILSQNEPAAAKKMPDTYSELVREIPRTAGVIAYIEQLSIYMGRGVQNNATLFKNYGAWEMLFAVLHIPVRFVVPSTWQAGVGALKPPPKPVKLMTEKEHSAWYRAKKKANKILAARLFPQVKVTYDVADALLIAEYGRLKEEGKVI